MLSEKQNAGFSKSAPTILHNEYKMLPDVHEINTELSILEKMNILGFYIEMQTYLVGVCHCFQIFPRHCIATVNAMSCISSSISSSLKHVVLNH